MVRIARVYDPPGPDDGARVLVDRVWPRGLAKAKAALDDWCQAVAPSTELRKWYAHDPGRFAEFTRRYRAELTAPGPAADALAALRDRAAQGPLTLLTASRALDISQAAVLAQLLSED
ncbi:DUF488 family protein [Amycolatopsis sp. NPDC049253]|uniref:DUF488 domain-containing protein n=1 Tax=Amycolatopsis sp. NPDC049253 TaxID=3155274 RepID=UPI00342D8848